MYILYSYICLFLFMNHLSPVMTCLDDHHLLKHLFQGPTIWIPEMVQHTVQHTQNGGFPKIGFTPTFSPV